MSKLVAWILAIGLMVLGPGLALAQAYPSKPIRIVTADPGGGQDFAARLLAQGLAGLLAQTVIVNNRAPIASYELVAKAPADGYTLLLAGSPFWVVPLLRSTTYDPVKEFSPVTFAVSSPNILVVHPSVPVRSVKELISLAQARPGELNYAGAGIGSSAHLGAELFKTMARVNIVHVPYKSTGISIVAMIGGQVQLTFATSASVVTQVKAGKLRAIAVSSVKPSVLAPGLPTVAETLPGYEIGAASAMFVPAGTPAAVISRLNRDVVRLLSQAEVIEKFFNAGSEVVGGSPEEAVASVKSEMARLGKVIKDANIFAWNDRDADKLSFRLTSVPLDYSSSMRRAIVLPFESETVS